MKRIIKAIIINSDSFFRKVSHRLGIESYYICLRSRLLLLFKQGVQFNADIRKVFKYGAVAMNRWVVDAEKNVAFLHIPYTGGTLVVNSMYNADASYDVFSNLEEISESDIGTVSKGRVMSKDINFKGFRFAYVRNPFERLVGIYEMCMGKTVQYERYLFGYLNTDDFEKWIRKLVKIPYFLMEDHISSQYRHIYKNGKPLVSYIGRFEEIDKSLPQIIKMHNLGQMIERKRTPKSKGNWMNYYSLKSASLVYKKFRNDVDTFGYEDEYTKLIEYLKSKQEKERMEK